MYKSVIRALDQEEGALSPINKALSEDVKRIKHQKGLDSHEEEPVEISVLSRSF